MSYREDLLTRLKTICRDEFLETEQLRDLSLDPILLQFLSFHWIKFLNRFPKQLSNRTPFILYSAVSPSEKISLIFQDLSQSVTRVSSSEFLSFIQTLFKLHDFNKGKQDAEDIPRVYSAELKIDQVIGEGGFGTVYRGVWEGMDVAIKQLRLEALGHDPLQEFFQEAKIMHRCRHPNIVLFFALCIEPGKNSLIMEQLPKGSLYKNLSDSRYIVMKVNAKELKCLGFQFDGILHLILPKDCIIFTQERLFIKISKV